MKRSEANKVLKARSDFSTTYECFSTEEHDEGSFSRSGCEVCNSGGATVLSVKHLQVGDGSREVYESDICGACLCSLVNSDDSDLDYHVDDEDSFNLNADDVAGGVDLGRVIASKAADCFDTDTNKEGFKYYYLKDGSPEFLSSLIKDVHSRLMPDDHIYASVLDAFEALKHDDTDTARDSIDSDAYNSDLITWLGSHTNRIDIVDEAIDEYGAGDKSIISMIAAGQLKERLGVFDTVAEWITDQTEI